MTFSISQQQYDGYMNLPVLTENDNITVVVEDKQVPKSPASSSSYTSTGSITYLKRTLSCQGYTLELDDTKVLDESLPVKDIHKRYRGEAVVCVGKWDDKNKRITSQGPVVYDKLDKGTLRG